MRNKFIQLILLGFLTLMLAVSCASAPPPAQEETSFVPQEQGGNQGQVQETQPQELSPFEKLTGMTVDQYAEKMQKELDEAREDAVNAGAVIYALDELLQADKTVLSALDNYEVMDYFAAKENAEEALLMYQTIKAGLDANNIWLEITRLGMDIYDPENLKLGDDAIELAVLNYSEGDYFASKNSSERASHYYNEVLKNAYEPFSAVISERASAERQRALDERANVAAKKEFDSAESIFVQANTALRGQRFDEAVRFFIDCEPIFKEAADLAIAKKLSAEDAMRRADEKMVESDEIATIADQIVEGEVK